MNIMTESIKVHVLKTEWSVFKNYCYLIENIHTKEALLLDPSWEFDVIDQKLKELSLKPLAVLLTHHHQDHIHLAEKCALTYNIPAVMSAKEINFYQFHCTNLQALPDHPFLVGSISVNFIHTPGHTCGSVCYLIDDNFFTGDTLFNEGCGVCFGAGASPEQMFYSLQLIKDGIQDSTIIYPGHQFYSPVGQNFYFVKNNNIYLHFTSLDKFVAFRMREESKKGWLDFK